MEIIYENFDCKYLSFISELNCQTSDHAKNRVLKISTSYLAWIMCIYMVMHSRGGFWICAIFWPHGCHIWQYIIILIKPKGPLGEWLL